MDSSEHRKFVYGFCREALKRNATLEQVDYAVKLVSPLNGYRALGFRVRLQRKLDGESIRWSEI